MKLRKGGELASKTDYKLSFYAKCSKANWIKILDRDNAAIGEIQIGKKGDDKCL